MPAWLGPTEIIVIVLIIVLLFGFKKLPDAARSVGRSMRIFKAEVDEMKRDDKPSAASQETVAGQMSESATTNVEAGGQATPATGGTAAGMSRPASTSAGAAADAEGANDNVEPRA